MPVAVKRPADIGAVVRYEVELLRDGRGYSTRQVRGYQNGKPVYVALASFAAGEAGGTFDAVPPAGRIPDPDDLPTSAEYLDARAGSPLAEASWPTAGCSTPRKRSRRTRAAAWAQASSSPAITVTWPPWSRRGSSVLPEL